MTGKSKGIKLSTILSTLSSSSFHVEMKKSSRGLIAVASGVMSVNEYTDTSVELLSHSGRVSFIGESLGISVLEGKVVEIYGKITEVRFGYGKA